MDGVSNHFEGLAGYEAIFKTFIAMLVIALIATIVFRKLTKDRRAELAKMRTQPSGEAESK